jgi:superoxide reductase
MDRRNFVRFVLAGSSVAVLAPRLTVAGIPEQGMAGRVYYTADNPGRWSAKVKTHVPLIQIKKSEGTTTVEIITPHEMKGYEHYIVKHVLFDKKFEFLGEKIFDPTKDASPVSSFPLDGYTGTLYALSVCNLHDSWLNSAEV